MASEVFVRKASGLTRVISPKDALIYAWVNPGPVYAFIYIIWAGALYPGANMAWAVSMVLLLAPIMAVYYLFSISMPRSGGEYLYASRGLHPALGFFSCWALTIIGISWSGQLTSWEVTYGVADLFYNYGILNNVASATNIGVMLNEVASMQTFLVGLPILIIAFLCIWRGAKTVMRVSWACFIVSFIGLVAIVIASATSSHEFFVQRLHDLAGIEYSDLINSAKDQGMILGMTSIGSTVMAGMTYVNLNTLGSTYTTNVAGEIKQVSRAQPLALFGSLGLFILFWGIFYGTMWYLPPGGDFWTAIAYLQNVDAYSLMPVFPVANQVMVYVTSNPILIYLATIGFLFGNFGGIVGLSFGPTRNIFAFSFDRIFPERWAKVDRRGSPYISVLVAFLIALFVFVIYTFTTWMQYILFTITVWFAGWCVTGIAAMTYPWKRKDIFDKSPGAAKRKIGGIPVITIMGFLMLIVSAYTVYATTWPILVGGPIDPGNYVTAAIYCIVPFIIFAVSYYYRKAKGIPMEKQFAQIPPD